MINPEITLQLYCNSIRKNSLIEYMVPVGSDKVPCQRLTDGVTSNVSDGKGGILLTDHLGVQTILKVPETHTQSEDKSLLCHLHYFLLQQCLMQDH